MYTFADWTRTVLSTFVDFVFGYGTAEKRCTSPTCQNSKMKPMGVTVANFAGFTIVMCRANQTTRILINRSCGRGFRRLSEQIDGNWFHYYHW